MPDSARFPVRFDDEAFAEDVAHATATGRDVGLRERQALERDGVDVQRLRRCDAEGPDGTRLGGCVKCYLPAPDGQWGMVLRAWELEGPGLVCVAFGLRHPQRPWQQSVYRVAHRRLHPPPVTD